MSLTRSQQKYLKRNLKRLSLAKISAHLGVSEEKILMFLKSRWRKEKYQKFLAKAKHPRGVSRFPPRGWKQNWKVLAFLAFLVFAVYLNSLGNDFVSDDIAAIKENPNINKISYFLIPPYFKINLSALNVFIIHKIFGLNPVFYRLATIFSHLGCVWIIYLLIALFFSSPVPLFTASIFAVHSILAEVVIWISAGHYSQASFFILLSLFVYILSVNNKKTRFYLLSIFLFIFALLFSEKMVVFPLILLMYEFSFKRIKKNWPKLIPFWTISGFWALHLFGLLGERATALQTSFYQEPGIDNPLIQVPIAVTSYLELIFWPKNLTLYHSEMTFSQAEYFLRLGIFVLFLATIVFFLKRNRRIFFWLSFFLITLLPTLTPFRISWVVAERHVYLGALGIIVLIALAIQKLGEVSKNQKFSYLFLAIILLALSLRTMARNRDWKNQDTLWLAAAKTSPSSSQNHNNLGDLYARRGELEKAVEEFKKAISLKPNYGDAYHNLANTYQQVGKDDLAIENYQKALSFNPHLWQSHQNLAAIYFKQGKIELVKQELEKVLQIDPQNQRAKQLLLSL